MTFIQFVSDEVKLYIRNTCRYLMCRSTVCHIPYQLLSPIVLFAKFVYESLTNYWLTSYLLRMKMANKKVNGLKDILYMLRSISILG